MTIKCNLRILLAKMNVEFAKQGKSALSLRKLAKETGVSLSVLASLNTGRSKRIDYITIDRLLTYFSAYVKVSMNDLLEWEKTSQEEPQNHIRRKLEAEEMII